MTFEAVLFDLDATLLDYDDAAYALTVQRVCRALVVAEPRLDLSQLVATYSALNRQRWQVPAASLAQTRSGLDNGRSIWRDTWHLALSSCGCDDAALAALALGLYVRDVHASYRLFDDALGVLDALSGRVRMAVVTNGPSDIQRDKLQAMGIQRYFDAVVISGEVGVAKPEASAFRLALAGLGVEPVATLHVGDSLRLDVAGAHNAGLTSVWLNRHGAVRSDTDPEPHREIASLTELLPLLAGKQ